MQVTVKLYAGLSEYLPPGSVDQSTVIQATGGTTISRIIERLNIPPERAHLVLLNGVYVKPEDRNSTVPSDGDALAMWPPVAGG